MKKVQLTKPQQTIVNSAARFKLICGARRFGKSWLSMRQMCYFARKPNQLIYYLAPTYRMARQIIFDDLKERLEDLRWLRNCNISDMRFELINGSKIFLRGADDGGSKIRGVSMDYCVMDEFSMMDPKVWEVVRPALSDRQGHAMWISSPMGKNHFYDLFMWAQDQQGWATFKYTTAQGGNVPIEEIELAKQEMDEKTFRQEYMADWIDYVGLVYFSFNENHVRKFKEEKPKELYVGNDFNVDPLSAVVAVREPWGLHIIDEIELRNSNTFELVDEIKKRYPTNKINIWPDPAGSARKTSSTTTDHKILANAGFNVHVKRAHPAVKDRINSVNSAFHSGKILIDPKCKSLMNCLNKLSYRPGGNEPDKGGSNDYTHMTDALGYMIEYLYPIRRITQPRVEPARWAIGAPQVRKFG